MDIFSVTIITAILGCLGFYVALFICVLVKMPRQEKCSNDLKFSLLVITLQLTYLLTSAKTMRFYKRNNNLLLILIVF